MHLILGKFPPVLSIRILLVASDGKSAGMRLGNIPIHDI